MVRRTLGLLTLIGSLIACGSGGGSTGTAAQPAKPDRKPPDATPAVADARLTEQDWRLESLGAVGEEKPILGGTLITLEFGADGWIDGFSGCNKYRTTYRPGTAGTLAVRAEVRTNQSCPETIERQERTFLDVLHRVETYEVADGRLRLRYEGGSRNLIFRGVPDASLEKPEPTPSLPVPTSSQTQAKEEEPEVDSRGRPLK